MKAILVIDMPKSCRDCKLTYLDTGDDAYFGVNVQRCILDDAEADTDERYYDCPLRPLPHKLQADWYTDGYKEGFNACLEEIEK